MATYMELLKPRATCPVCKGSNKDPKKRKRACPAPFCNGGYILGMCDCLCHVEESMMHIMPCCPTGGSRVEYDKALDNALDLPS